MINSNTVNEVMHSKKEVGMLAAKMDLHAKRVEPYEKMSAQETLKAMDSP